MVGLTSLMVVDVAMGYTLVFWLFGKNVIKKKILILIDANRMR